MASKVGSYAEELAWLYGLQARGIHLNLDRMQGALEVRGMPQRGLKVIHVAGSNGKGSVCAMTESILRAAGYKTGLFTSPHLHRYAERVRIDGKPLADDEIARRIAGLRDAQGSMPRLTFFENTALMAFEAFRDHEVDVVILEVGLGGRLDATNVLEAPLATVITRIAIDHKRILGDNLADIAREKGGILRPDVPAVLGMREQEPQQALREMAAEVGVGPLAILGEDFDGARDASTVRLRFGTEEERFELGLLGEHQAQNAAIAVAGIRASGLEVSDEALREGLAQAHWAGRLEQVGERVLVDAAHNPDGCRALAAHLRTLPGSKVLLFGAMADKDHEAMLAPFDDAVAERVYAIPPMRRAPESTEIFSAVRPGVAAASVSEGLRLAQERVRALGEDAWLVVAGSIFLLNEVRAALLGIDCDPPIGM